MSNDVAHDRVALAVIFFLGVGMLLGLGGVILLVHESINSANQVDPSTVALVSGVSTLVGMGFGALGAILGRPAAPTQPAGTESDPVAVQVTDAGAGELRFIGLVILGVLAAVVIYHLLAPHLC